jgi:predicted dehydrogenase
MKDLSIVLVGIGGYGNSFVNWLLDANGHAGAKIAAAVDPNPTRCARLPELLHAGVPVFSNLEDFYRASHADLAVLSTPIHLHARQTIAALENGSHVLCEKPLCTTPDEAARMQAAETESGGLVAIGYQWSFSRAIQSLKRDILNGDFGRPLHLRTLVLWPRDEAYYRRNRWAGALRDTDGNWVLDSPVNNACAHHLHNMLYVLGSDVARSARPAELTAELYRAQAIENYDTAAIRVRTDDNIELLFIVSHSTHHLVGPRLSYEFEHGVIEYDDAPGAQIVARMNDGTVRAYGCPNEAKDRKLWLTIDAVRRQRATLCGISAAQPHTQCVWAAQQSGEPIRAFPRDLVRIEGVPGHRVTWVEGLTGQLLECFESRRLPSECGFSWAHPSRAVVAPANPTTGPKVNVTVNVPKRRGVGAGAALPS